MKHKSGAKANLWWAKIWVNFPHYCYLTPMMILILVLEILMSLIWELLLPRWRGRTNDGRTEEMGEDQIWRHFGWGDTVDGDDGDHIGGFHVDDDGDVELWIKRRIKLENKVIEDLSWNTGSSLWKQTKSFLHRETFWFCEKGKSSGSDGTKVIKGWYKNDKYYDKKDNDDHDIYVIMIIRLWRWRWRGSYLWQRCQLGSFYCSVMPL